MVAFEEAKSSDKAGFIKSRESVCWEHVKERFQATLTAAS